MKGLGRIPCKRDKIEFCYMYAELFDKLIDKKTWDDFKSRPEIQIIGDIARKWFNYADTYVIHDMVWSLFKFYQANID